MRGEGGRKFVTWLVLLLACACVFPTLASAWPPWGGSKVGSAPAGGGAVQGVPTQATFVPPTFGTATQWTGTTLYPAHQVIVPSASHVPTGFWYTSQASCTSGSTEPAECAAFGCTFTDNTCTWQATGTVQPQPSVWTTAFDFDWTQGSSTSFSTDGTFTFGGTTWTKVNSANETVHASAGGGTGLNLQPNSGVFYANTTRTAPMVEVPITTAVPWASMATPVRVLINETAGNQGVVASNNCAGTLDLGYEMGNTSWPSEWVRTGWNCGSGGTCATNPLPCLYTQGNWNGTVESFNVPVNAPTGATGQLTRGAIVIMAEFPQGVGGALWREYIANLPAVGTWPADGSFTMVGSSLGSVTTPQGWYQTMFSQSALPTMSQVMLTIMASSQSTVAQSGMSVTVNRIRVDYKL